MPGAQRLPNGLTPKQDAFAAELIANGGNVTQAALKSYNVSTYGSAAIVGMEALNSLKKHEISRCLPREIVERWTKKRSRIPKALRKIEAALDAETEDKRPDHRVRVTAAKEILKLADAYPKNQLDISISGSAPRDWDQEFTGQTIDVTPLPVVDHPGNQAIEQNASEQTTTK